MGRSPVLALNDESFDEALRAFAGPIVVDFWATWCLPCKTLAPWIDELALEFTRTARFAKVDVDQGGDLVNRFGIQSVPTLIVFKGGRIVDQLVGAAPKDKIRRMVERHLSARGVQN